MPTVKEVATLAGVSPMTVSRTLAGGNNVRPQMQKRVLDAVRELGYYRNETARALRPGQASGLIGVAITNLANPYYGSFALGVEEIARQYGRRILLGNTGEDAARERQLVSDFVGRQVEGLILVPSGGNTDHLQPEILHGIPLVLASRIVPGIDTDVVLLDDIGGAYLGTKDLLEAGHRRIAFLGNAESVFTGQRRYTGFTQALDEFGLVPDPVLVKRDQQDIASARTAMKALLDLSEPPTAVFASNNRNAIGALMEIGARLRLGADAAGFPAIASFDDFELAELMPVPVTIVDHDPRELGREAARLLFTRLTDGAMASREVEMPTRVHAARE
ncbi:LacI family DNA-binding transcriptional regulator [Arthrobacter sp. ok362]|uniref:LacI family DNA-binding transcriptional regulator n=1 Tax=Arthrobacter sp. ok362 TaxID=1761745 RepID=UPI001C311C22|nr:LacI family DNA-binding transcriptional regulator [Arthrobacter sp. ok362]